MMLEALCVALAELSVCLLVIVVFEMWRPSSNRFSDCRCSRPTHSHKQHTNVSDISDIRAL